MGPRGGPDVGSLIHGFLVEIAFSFGLLSDISGLPSPEVRLVESPLYVGEVGRNNMQQQMLVGQEAGTQQPISLVV